MSDIETAYAGDKVRLTKGDYEGAEAVVEGPGDGWTYVVRLITNDKPLRVGMDDFENLTRGAMGLVGEPRDTLEVNGTARSIMAETVSSSSPGVSLGPSKAIASGIAGTAIAFLGGLSIAYADDVITGQEWVNIAIATVLGATAAFGITYATPTNVTLK